MVLGTKNPANMPGRFVQNDLCSCLLNYTLPPYSQEELYHILHAKKLPESRARELVAIYLEEHNFAKKEGLKPVPCFRDLIKLSELLLTKDSEREEAETRWAHPVKSTHITARFFSTAKPENHPSIPAGAGLRIGT